MVTNFLVKRSLTVVVDVFEVHPVAKHDLQHQYNSINNQKILQIIKNWK